MSDLIIRPSEEEDMEAIHKIYEHEVLNGTATFDESPPSKEAMEAKRIDILSHGFPHIVAEMDGEVVGYGYISFYRQRSAYSQTVENSVYVVAGKQKCGIGYKLMQAVIEDCERLGLKNIIAVIGDSGNSGSIKLHQKLGFRKVGILTDVGFKFGRWLDVVLMQKTLR
ncbi:MAG: N-acetyltransferase [Alphaproteobacteria bacterium]|nr:N-acetyltransferase [Alphaproteobacteria bacterium]HPF47014.1 N-acetyltransferase family protein [Emcibacteraceae bacterium]